MSERLHKMVNGEKVYLSNDEETALQAEWQKNLNEQNQNQYILDRAREYPLIVDQLEAILKQLNYMQMTGQTDLIEEMDLIIQQWLEVKRKYPKPELTV